MKSIIFFLSIFMSLSLFSQIDTEPVNNTLAGADALAFGVDNKASLQSNNDSDYFKFTVTQPGVVIITVTNVPSNIDMDYEFFNELDLSVYSTNYGDGQGFVIDGLLCNPGTYTFRLGDNESNPAEYCVRVDFDTTDIYECNNTYETATPIPLATNIYASIYDEHDSDYYSFEITQPGVIIITVTNVPDNIDMDYEFFNELGLSVYTTNFGDGQGFVVDGLVCTPGTYTFRLWDNEANPAQYCVRVDFDTSDIYECNNTYETATPIPLATNIYASIYDEHDSDYYSFEITQPGVIIITVTNVPSNIDMDYEFFNELGLSVYTTNYGDGQGFVVDGLACTPGTYTFRLWDNEANPAQYCVRVDFDTSDIYECNNTYETATPIPFETNIYASIYDEHDSDYYSFEVTQPGVVVITVTNVPDNIDMDYEFFNELGLSVYSANYGDGQGFVIEGLACNVGTYVFRLGDNESNPAQYCVRVDFDINDSYECNQTFNTASEIACNDTIFATIRSVGDEDVYKLNIPSGHFRASVLNVPPSIKMQLVLHDENTNFIEATHNGVNPGTSIYYENLNLAPGIYYVILKDVGNNDAHPQQYVFLPDCSEATKTKEYLSTQNVNIYPNPVSKEMTIELEYFNQEVDFKIFNAFGQEFLSDILQAKTTALNVADLPAGVFFIEIASSDFRMVRKFIKE